MASRNRAAGKATRGDFAALRDRLCGEPLDSEKETIPLAAAPAGPLLEHLFSGGRCCFAPAPEPTLRELIEYHATTGNVAPEDVPLAELKPPPADVWARYCAGRDDAESLTAESRWSKSGDHLVLQSLTFPAALRQSLRNFAALDEDPALAGGRALYLGLGELRCQGGEDGEEEGEAFLLLPVELTRRVQGDALLSWGGAAAFLNPLVADLMGEADAAKLPGLGALEDPDAYLESAAAIVAKNPDLSLERGLSFSCAPLGAAWVQCDLRRGAWETSDDLLESPALLLADKGAKAGRTALDRPASDALDRDLEPILPCDGDQATVVVRAGEGQPLLALGAPGTGKTHAAAALAGEFLGKGKTVLYLSDHAPSQETFRALLEEAGLASALLALSPDRLSAADLLERLEDAGAALKIAGGGDDLEAARTRLEPLREEMQALWRAGEAQVGAMNLKVNNVLFELGRLRLEHPRLVPLIPQAPGFDALTVDQERRKAAKERLLETEAAVAKVAAKQPLASHPWAGVAELSLTGEEARQPFFQKAEALRASLADLLKALKKDVAPLEKSIQLDDRLLGDFRGLAEQQEALEQAKSRIEAAAALAGKVLDGLRIKASNEPASILAVRDMIAFAGSAPDVLDQVPRSLLSEYDMDDRLAALEPELTRLGEAAELLSSSFDIEKLRELGDERLQEMARILRKRGLLKSTDGEWRAARKDLKAVRRLKGRATDSLMPDLLEAAASFLQDEALFFEETEAAHLLGEDLESAAHWHAEFAKGRDWINRVEAAFDSGFARQVQIGPAMIALERGELESIAQVKNDAAFSDLTWAAEQLQAAGRDWGYARTTAWAGHISSKISEENAKLFAKVKPKEAPDLLALAATLGPKIAAYDAAWKTFREAAKLREGFWLPGGEADLAQRLRRVDHALSDRESLGEWAALMGFLNKDREPGVVEITKAVVAGTVPKAAACDLYDLMLFEGLARHARKEFPVLDRYDAEARERLRGDYLEAERLLRAARAAWTAAACAKKRDAAKALDLSSASSPEAVFALGLQADGDALLSRKPCMAMAPALAARLLPPRPLLFDLVILDAAEDLGAAAVLPGLLRAKQLAVFANPLPKGAQPEDPVLARFGGLLPVVELTHHYRGLPDAVGWPLLGLSGPGSLDLPIVPRDPEAEPGLLLRNEWCPGERNLDPQREAEACAEALLASLKGGQGESLAVVTLDGAQALRIEEALELALEDNPALSAKLAGPEGRGEPLVVVPLSELPPLRRDVIYLSPGIGKEGLVAGSLDALPHLLMSHAGRLEIFCGLDAKAVAAAGGKDPMAGLLSRLVARASALSAGDPGLPKRELGRLERSLDRALSPKGLQLRPDPADPRGSFFIEQGSAAFTPLAMLHLDRGAHQKRDSLRDREAPIEARRTRLGWRILSIEAANWSESPQTTLERLLGQLATKAAESAEARKRQA